MAASHRRRLKQFAVTKAERDAQARCDQGRRGPEDWPSPRRVDPIRLAATGKALGNTLQGHHQELMRGPDPQARASGSMPQLDEVRRSRRPSACCQAGAMAPDSYQRGLHQVLSCATLGTPAICPEMDDLKTDGARRLISTTITFPPLFRRAKPGRCAPRPPRSRPRRPRRSAP